VFVPCGEAPHKVIEADPGREARLEMTRAAVAGDPAFSVSAIEVERAGPSFTFETLEELGPESGEAELILILGADAALGLDRWKRPERIVELARLGIADRAGVGEEELASALERAGATGRGLRFELPEVPVSSTAVRERAARGDRLDDLVPIGVADLIEREGLYR
jgi:nicotinate-nucleotide adenylyltransferase